MVVNKYALFVCFCQWMPREGGQGSLLLFTSKGGVGSGIYFPPLPQIPLLSFIPSGKKTISQF